VNDKTIIWSAAAMGAVAGGVLGYLLLTERGRAQCVVLERWFEDVLREATRVSQLAARVGQFADQGVREWKAVRGTSQSATH
jgi:hypothetical protein